MSNVPEAPPGHGPSMPGVLSEGSGQDGENGTYKEIERIKSQIEAVRAIRKRYEGSIAMLEAVAAAEKARKSREEEKK